MKYEIRLNDHWYVVTRVLFLAFPGRRRLNGWDYVGPSISNGNG